MEEVTVDTQDYIEALKTLLAQQTEAIVVLQAQIIHLKKKLEEPSTEAETV